MFIFPVFCFFAAYLIVHTILLAILVWFVVCKLGVDVHFRRGTLMTNTESYDD